LLEFLNVSKIYKVREGGLFRTKYRYVKAVENVTLSVKKGETLVILGPNGAGKSTLCKLAAGMVKPTSGRVVLDGVDVTENVRHVSKRIGVVFGPSLVYYRMTGYQYLRFFSKIYDVKNYDERIVSLSRLLGLEDWLSAYIESYSLGMKVKISLVRALLHDPAVLILDEFTLGLDPKSARDVRGIIKQLGKTVLLTTHNTLEAGEMAGRIAFMSKGRIVALGSAEELMSKVKQRMSVWVRFKDKGNAVKALSSLGNITLRENADGKIEITFERDSMESLIQSISRFGILEIETRRIGLEDAYLFYTGRALEEHA